MYKRAAISGCPTGRQHSQPVRLATASHGYGLVAAAILGPFTLIAVMNFGGVKQMRGKGSALIRSGGGIANFVVLIVFFSALISAAFAFTVVVFTRPPQEYAVTECKLDHPQEIQECMRVRGYDLVYGVTDRCNKLIGISDELPYCYVPTNRFVYQVYRLRMAYEGVKIIPLQ